MDNNKKIEVRMGRKTFIGLTVMYILACLEGVNIAEYLYSWAAIYEQGVYVETAPAVFFYTAFGVGMVYLLARYVVTGIYNNLHQALDAGIQIAYEVLRGK